MAPDRRQSVTVPPPSGRRTQSEIDFADALNLLRQAGVRPASGVAPAHLREEVSASSLAHRPISELLCALAVGDRLASDFPPGALEDGALSADLLALRVSKEARIDPAAALTALARLSGQAGRLTGGVQALQPGDGFEYLRFTFDGATREITIDATAGFDPAAELGRLARSLERGRSAFYLHRRGALMIVLYLYEESAEALNAAEPGLLEALTSLEVDTPLLRLSRKTLRRLPILGGVIAAASMVFVIATGSKLFGLGPEAFGLVALALGGASFAYAFRR